jgi:hypothetical protein
LRHVKKSRRCAFGAHPLSALAKSFLGFVTAPTSEAAQTAAVEEFRLSAALRRRLEGPAESE